MSTILGHSLLINCFQDLLYMYSIMCVHAYSADNCNSAHVGDECNPKWHVQTPAVQLNITSDPSVSSNWYCKRLLYNIV